MMNSQHKQLLLIALNDCQKHNEATKLITENLNENDHDHPLFKKWQQINL